jgi:hypothetical protein
MTLPETPPVDEYLCVGICMADPDSGYCLGCGRPPLAVPGGAVVAELAPPSSEPSLLADPDSPVYSAEHS